MKSFLVTVRTPERNYHYTAISQCSADIVADAIDRFGPCGVFVRAQS